MFISSIRKYSDIDILCLVDGKENSNFNLEYNNLFTQKVFSDEFKFDSKYRIKEWENHSNYDNFLYLDVDHVCVSDFYDVFYAISENSNYINSVEEFFNLNESGYNHKFSNKIFNDNCKAYNAGCFSFSKQLIDEVDSILPFIEKNAHYTLHDQPLFNEYFNEKNLLTDLLSGYVFLDCNCENHNIVNSKKNNQYIKFVHVLSGFGQVENKFLRMKEIIKNK
jgi:hypothetical protein